MLSLLKHFGFPQFTDEFIGRLKTQVALVIEAAKEDYNWDAVDGAAAYNHSLENKNKKRAERVRRNSGDIDELDKDEGDGRTRTVICTWRDDPGERARRIWLWWKDHRLLSKDFSLAARLVALVQVSSASVERLFSQLKLVVDAVGESMLEETLETRLFVLENSSRERKR